MHADVDLTPDDGTDRLTCGAARELLAKYPDDTPLLVYIADDEPLRIVSHFGHAALPLGGGDGSGLTPMPLVVMS